VQSYSDVNATVTLDLSQTKHPENVKQRPRSGVETAE